MGGGVSRLLRLWMDEHFGKELRLGMHHFQSSDAIDERNTMRNEWFQIQNPAGHGGQYGPPVIVVAVNTEV